MQFKPPVIPYVPSWENMETVWAVCKFGSLGGIRFTQTPGQPIVAERVFPLRTPPNKIVSFTLQKYGYCELDNSNEFNPLEEKDKDGNPAMYQDPMRGRLQGFTTDA